MTAACTDRSCEEAFLRDGNDAVVVDHYVQAHYYLEDGERYRTEVRVPAPTTGRSTDC